MIRKPKSAKAQPKSNGRHEPKASKTQPKSNGRHDLKATKTPAKTTGHVGHHATSERTRSAPIKHEDRPPQKFSGILQDFNFGPKGGVEGFLLHSDGQTVQVNVSVDVGFAVVRGIGQHVEATVEPDDGDGKRHHGDHPVFKLITLTGTDGKGLIFSGTGDGEKVTVEGVIKRINYARHGAANGVVLESGDFIHLKPEGMKRAGLNVGDHVTAEGTATMMPLGQRVIEAKTVNNVGSPSKKTTAS